MAAVGSVALWWIKRDFRLYDNPAYSRALAESDLVLPVFFLEPSLIRAEDTGRFHGQAQYQALAALQRELAGEGSGVRVLPCEVVDGLEHLWREQPFQVIYAHQETGVGYTFERDKAVIRWCRARGVRLVELPQNGVIRGLAARDGREKLWWGYMTAPRPGRAPVRPLPTDLRARWMTPLPETTDLFRPWAGPHDPRLQTVTESAAWSVLDSFLQERGLYYRGGISSPNRAFTAGSRLSPHLAWGTISLRAVFQEARQRREVLAKSVHPDDARFARSLTSFLSRLHWHDHFIQRLESEPAMEFHALNPVFENPPYVTGALADDRLAAYLAGRTGFPMIDACMRCLAATGFLNFRMRAMITSFACHALRLDWRVLHPPLARLWLDYEPGIHLAQLQMQAGVVGINTFRVYSPLKQLQDQDPQCRFVRRWLPELAGMTDEQILSGRHDLQAGVAPPVIDFAAETALMKQFLYERKRSAENRVAQGAVLAKHGSRKAGKPKAVPSVAPRTRRRKAPDTPPVLTDDLFAGLDGDPAAG